MHNTPILYGVGMNYQLLELQQVYRHPKKIYDVAVNIANQSAANHVAPPTSKSSTNSSFKSSNLKSTSSSSTSSSNVNSTTPSLHSNIIQSPPKIQLSVSDFYKNYVLPVLIPIHYCCSPILFCTNWNDYIVTENMLGQNSSSNLSVFNTISKSDSFQRNNSAITLLSKQQSVSNLVSLSSNQIISQPTKTQNPVNPANELWYKKMRHIFLIEYSKYFESRGFIHLKDDRSPVDSQVLLILYKSKVNI